MTAESHERPDLTADVPTVALTDARAELSRIVTLAEHTGRITPITRYGKPVAAVVPAALLPLLSGANSGPAPIEASDMERLATRAQAATRRPSSGEISAAVEDVRAEGTSQYLSGQDSTAGQPGPASAVVFVVMRQEVPVHVTGRLDRAQAAAIAAATEYTPADRIPQHRWDEADRPEGALNLQARGTSSGRWSKTGYSIVPVPAGDDPAPVLAAIEQTTAFIHRSVRREFHATGDTATIDSDLGLLLRTTALAHGTATTAYAAGRPELASTALGDLADCARRWEQFADHPHEAISVLRAAAPPAGAR